MTHHLSGAELEGDHGFAVDRLGSVTSTQDELRRRLTAGRPIQGVAVRAREQTAGRGRRGTAWNSPPGGSYQSVGLPLDWASSSPDTNVAPASLLPLALGVGVAATFTRAGATTMVKWPNDLVLDGYKLGGIIVEVISGVPVAGIGVNVDNDVPEGAAALRGLGVEAVGDLVLLGVRRAVTMLRDNSAGVVEAFAAVDWLRGKSVMLSGADQVGIGRGIDEAGCLLLSSPDGDVSRHCSGHVVAIDGNAWASARNVT